MLEGLIGFTLSFAAAGLVFYSWRRRKQPWAAATGWLLAFGSTIPWSLSLGTEIGVSYAIMVFICLIWVEVFLTVDTFKGTGGAPLRPYRRLRRPGLQACIKHGVLFLLSVPGTGIIAMMLCVALTLFLPWSMPARFAVAIFLYPVLWGALSAWICAQNKIVKPVVVSLGLLAISSLLLFT